MARSRRGRGSNLGQRDDHPGEHEHDDRDLSPEPEAVQTPALSRERAVTVVSGRPRPAALLGRSRWSHFDTRVGSVEMISSSKPCTFTASWMAASGSGTPIIASTGPP